MFIQVSVCPQQGHAWWGGMCGRGACVAGGHAWQGGYAWQGECAWQGGMHGRGSVHDRGTCMAGGHVWQGACMAGGAYVAGGECMAEVVSMAGHAHTPGRYYEILSMSGRYASYWNAFLLLCLNFSSKLSGSRKHFKRKQEPGTTGVLPAWCHCRLHLCNLLYWQYNHHLSKQWSLEWTTTVHT